jgi:uncharacterized protein (TIGR03086 family)
MTSSMDAGAGFRRASEGFVQRAQVATDEQWSAPTPCTEWDLRALVNHVAGEYLWVPEMLAGRTVADVGSRLDGDLLGDNPVQALITAQQRAVAAVEEPDALSRTVHLSFGDTPAVEYAQQMMIDSVIHSWDVARALGGDEALDPELVEVAYAELQNIAEDWRAAGVFGPMTAASGDSTQAKLLALSGRQPQP